AAADLRKPRRTLALADRLDPAGGWEIGGTAARGSHPRRIVPGRNRRISKATSGLGHAVERRRAAQLAAAAGIAFTKNFSTITMSANTAFQVLEHESETFHPLMEDPAEVLEQLAPRVQQLHDEIAKVIIGHEDIISAV